MFRAIHHIGSMCLLIRNHGMALNVLKIMEFWNGISVGILIDLGHMSGIIAWVLRIITVPTASMNYSFPLSS